MPQKKQTEEEQLKTLKSRLAVPFPKELIKESGSNIALTDDDEKALDKAWEEENKRQTPK